MTERAPDEPQDQEWTTRTYRKLTVWATCADLAPETIKDLLSHLDHGFVALCETGSREMSQSELNTLHEHPSLGAAMHHHTCGSETIATFYSPVSGDATP